MPIAQGTVLCAEQITRRTVPCVITLQIRKGDFMKKVLAGILIIGFVLSAFSLFFTNRKLDSILNKYNDLSKELDSLSCKVSEQLTAVIPLSLFEVETFQHNIEILEAFYGVPSDRPAAIANACFGLKRDCKMASAWIEEIQEYNIPENNYYCIRIITDDKESYWFSFEYDSSYIYMIRKGDDKETLLYGVIE